MQVRSLPCRSALPLSTAEYLGVRRACYASVMQHQRSLSRSLTTRLATRRDPLASEGTGTAPVVPARSATGSAGVNGREGDGLRPPARIGAVGDEAVDELVVEAPRVDELVA